MLSFQSHQSTVLPNPFTLEGFFHCLSGCSAFLLERSIADVWYDLSWAVSITGPYKWPRNYWQINNYMASLKNSNPFEIYGKITNKNIPSVYPFCLFSHLLLYCILLPKRQDFESLGMTMALNKNLAVCKITHLNNPASWSGTCDKNLHQSRVSYSTSL